MTGSKIEMMWPENLNKRSQDLPEAYHDSGQFYWMWTEKFLKNKKLFGTNSGAIILNDLLVQDIDNLEDWKLAEVKYEIINK
jgi:N-acylneuraminate cytidylyltransferase